MAGLLKTPSEILDESRTWTAGTFQDEIVVAARAPPEQGAHSSRQFLNDASTRMRDSDFVFNLAYNTRPLLDITRLIVFPRILRSPKTTTAARIIVPRPAELTALMATRLLTWGPQAASHGVVRVGGRPTSRSRGATYYPSLERVALPGTFNMIWASEKLFVYMSLLQQTTSPSRC
ncbi:hypothetical protein GWK47_016374 [Chionoecetes opilio]|uniref:Uncharacterized protein n=1 Tax=Chionoecetes opilio TaxID=41210 RepID=A0A8J5CHU7_CHIOP|nr:hypothetical protein GWK47_016374 [Chionoecetes opilio]